MSIPEFTPNEIATRRLDENDFSDKVWMNFKSPLRTKVGNYFAAMRKCVWTINKEVKRLNRCVSEETSHQLAALEREEITPRKKRELLKRFLIQSQTMKENLNTHQVMVKNFGKERLVFGKNSIALSTHTKALEKLDQHIEFLRNELKVPADELAKLQEEQMMLQELTKKISRPAPLLEDNDSSPSENPVIRLNRTEVTANNFDRLAGKDFSRLVGSIAFIRDADRFTGTHVLIGAGQDVMRYAQSMERDTDIAHAFLVVGCDEEKKQLIIAEASGSQQALTRSVLDLKHATEVGEELIFYQNDDQEFQKRLVENAIHTTDDVEETHRQLYKNFDCIFTVLRNNFFGKFAKMRLSSTTADLLLGLPLLDEEGNRRGEICSTHAGAIYQATQLQMLLEGNAKFQEAWSRRAKSEFGQNFDDSIASITSNLREHLREVEAFDQLVKNLASADTEKIREDKDRQIRLIEERKDRELAALQQKITSEHAEGVDSEDESYVLQVDQIKRKAYEEIAKIKKKSAKSIEQKISSHAKKYTRDNPEQYQELLAHREAILRMKRCLQEEVLNFIENNPNELASARILLGDTRSMTPSSLEYYIRQSGQVSRF